MPIKLLHLAARDAKGATIFVNIGAHYNDDDYSHFD
jgi:hypothetical protein